VETIRANGQTFAYLSEGTGPLVLLLHGFPDTAYSWDRVMPAVAAAGFRAVAPFMRGYHPTEIPADGRYDSDTLGRDVLALIEALAPGEQAIVVGHDWGASAAYAAAGLRPELMKLLVTIGIPHPRSVIPTPRILWTVRHFLTLRFKNAGEKIRANDFALVDELVRRWSPAWKNIPASETSAVKRAFAEPGCAEAACGYYAAISPRLPKGHRVPIRVPSVAFAGEHDNIAPRAFEKARRLYESSYEVVIVPGGHFMHREHPEPFISALVQTLNDKGRPATT
jgi:pimeloyl-ACP methyl ester carboxylesterase